MKLRNAQQIFFKNPDASYAGVAYPSGLASAEANFRQVHMMDQGNLLARREDMNVKALSYPLRYFQNTTFSTSDSISDNKKTVQLNLTGLNAGLVCV